MFVSTVDRELADPATISHHYDPNFFRFWLTPKWFILISSKKSVICDRSEVRRAAVYYVSGPNGASPFLYVFLNNGSKRGLKTAVKRDSIPQVMRILKQEMPHIVDAGYDEA